MKVVAFIPVRGGSKSIPGKNIKTFNGKPLLYWSVLAAQNNPEITEIIVATDDTNIAQTALSFQFNKLKVYERAAENANDTASTESVMLEYLQKSSLDNTDRFILIQATNPFLTSNDLNQGLKLMNESPNSSIISCATFKRFLWNRNGTPMNYDYNQRPRRQDFQGILLENGSFYINTVGNILRTKNRLSEPVQICEMPEFSSFEIDEPEDWIICEKIHAKYILSNIEQA